MHTTDEYVRYAMHQIRLGRRKSMPGIATCHDCHSLYRNDYSGIHWCPDCRVNHDRICQHCRTRFDGDRSGTRLCFSCQHQHTLFSGET